MIALYREVDKRDPISLPTPPWRTQPWHHRRPNMAITRTNLSGFVIQINLTIRQQRHNKLLYVIEEKGP